MYVYKGDAFVVDFQIQSTVHMSFMYRPVTKKLKAIDDISGNESK